MVSSSPVHTAATSLPPTSPPRTPTANDEVLSSSTPKSPIATATPTASDSDAINTGPSDFFDSDSLSVKTWRSHSPLKIRERISLLFSPSGSKPATSAFIAPDTGITDEVRETYTRQKTIVLPTNPQDDLLTDDDEDSAYCNTPTDVQTLLNTIRNQQTAQETIEICKPIPPQIPASRLVMYMFPEQASLFQAEREWLTENTNEGSKSINFQLRYTWKIWTEKINDVPEVYRQRDLELSFNSTSDSLEDTPLWHMAMTIQDRHQLDSSIANYKPFVLQNNKFGICLFKEGYRPVLAVHPRHLESPDDKEHPSKPKVFGVIRIPIRSKRCFKAFQAILKLVLEDSGRFDMDAKDFLAKNSICGVSFQKGESRLDAVVISLTISEIPAFEDDLGSDHTETAKRILNMLGFIDYVTFDYDLLLRAKFDTRYGRLLILDCNEATL